MKCEECGEEFEPRAPNQKFCSPQHTRRANKRKQRAVQKAAKERRDKAKAAIDVLAEVIPRGGRDSQTKYDPEERDFYLRALALAGGSPTAAQRGLAELGFEVPKHALQDFKRNYADRYGQIREQVAPELKAQRAEAHEALADKLTDVVDLAVDRLQEALENGELKPHQLSGTMRDAVVSAGINRDKAAKLRGEEVKLVHYRSPDEILMQLKKIAPAMVIEGEAKEIPASTGQSPTPKGERG